MSRTFTIIDGFPRQMGLIAIASLLAIASAHGQVVVFSTLTTPNNTGVEVIGLSIFGVLPSIWAARFIPNGDFNLVDAKVSVAAEGGNSAFNVFLAADDRGEVEKSSNWRQIGFGLIPPAGGGVVTANSISRPIALTSGNSYWLVLTAANQQGRMIWNLGGSPPILTQENLQWASINPDSGWMDEGLFHLQFQIDGTPPPPVIPLPPSLILCLIGLTLVGLFQLRRKLIT